MLKVIKRAAIAAAIGLGIFSAPAARAEELIGQINAASLQRVGEIAKQLGQPLPPPLTPDGLAETFPFLKDGILADKPIGIAFIGGEGLNWNQMLAFGIPIKNGFAVDPEVLKSLKDSNVPIKTSAKYFIFGGTEKVTPTVGDDRFATEFAIEGVLDLVAVRPALPKTWADMRGEKANDPSEQFGRDVLFKVVDALDIVAFRTDVKEDRFIFDLSLNPVQLDPLPKFARPKMPDYGARIDVTQGASQVLRFAAKSLLEIAKNEITDPKEAEQVNGLLEIANRVLTADAFTVSVGKGENGPLLAVVLQYNEIPNIDRLMNRLAEDLAKIAKGREKIEVTPIEAGTDKGKRFTFKEGDQAVMVFEYVVSGSKLKLLAGQSIAEGAMKDFANQGDDGPATGILQSEFLLGRLADAFGDEGLAKKLKGQIITVNAEQTRNGKGIKFRFNAPVDAFKLFKEIAQ